MSVAEAAKFLTKSPQAETPTVGEFLSWYDDGWRDDFAHSQSLLFQCSDNSGFDPETLFNILMANTDVPVKIKNLKLRSKASLRNVPPGYVNRFSTRSEENLPWQIQFEVMGITFKFGSVAPYPYAVAEGFRNAALSGLAALSLATAAHAAPPAQAPAKQVQAAKAAMPSGQDITAATLVGEAGGETEPEAMQSIMNVIANRAGGDPTKFAVHALKWRQFSMFNSATSRHTTPDPAKLSAIVAKCAAHPAWAKAKSLVAAASAGTLPDVTKGAKHYYNPRLANPAWKNDYAHTVTIGNHVFLK